MQAARTLAAAIEGGSDVSSLEELRTSLLGSTTTLLADDDTWCCEVAFLKFAFQRCISGRAEETLIIHGDFKSH